MAALKDFNVAPGPSVRHLAFDTLYGRHKFDPAQVFTLSSRTALSAEVWRDLRLIFFSQFENRNV
jgi:hypothetical protein